MRGAPKQRWFVHGAEFDEHVEHILAKLGFTSRAQVAAWVAEQRAGSAHG